MTLTIGKITGLPIEEYHAANAVSHSKLEDFRSEPRAYYDKHVSKTIQRDETDDMLIGSAAHCLILEGSEKYASEYSVLPEDAPRKGSKAYSALVVDGLTALKFEQDALVKRMQMAVAKNELAARLIACEGFEPEVTWRIELEGGVYIQCRTDGWIERLTQKDAEDLNDIVKRLGSSTEFKASESIVLDLKTCQTLTQGRRGSFHKGLEEFGYHRQQSFYTSIINEVFGDKPDHFFFVAVEKQAPFDCIVNEIPEEDVQTGFDEIKDGDASRGIPSLKDLLTCYRNDVWPRTQKGVCRIGLSDYYKRYKTQNT